MRANLTTALDVLGLLLFAAGAAALTYRWIGWACLMVSGVLIIGASALAAYLGRPKRGDNR